MPFPLALQSIAHVYEDLRVWQPSWTVELSRPSGAGWIEGVAFRDASAGDFHDLLIHIGERQRSPDRKTIAASFALRYGWSAGAAIAPYITHRAVPDLALENVSLKFSPSTFFERTALHDPRGVVGVASEGYTPALNARLREALVGQAEEVVRSLHDWSGFSVRGIWGQITSSWASQFINVCACLSQQSDALPLMAPFFDGDDIVAAMRPRVDPVTHRGVTHVYQRRASCCRYYLIPGGTLCASCPLVSDEERRRRNIEYMDRLLAKRPRV
jgi:ferric iron reductase protein FhuF